ncbi:hypothetical protein OIU76_003505, partial [Salix suchowensis]
MIIFRAGKKKENMMNKQFARLFTKIDAR